VAPEVFTMSARLLFTFLLAAAAVGAGCARNIDVADASFGTRTRSNLAVVAGGIGPAGGPPLIDRFVTLAGKKPNGLGFVQNTPDTWGPFDVQIRTGFFDADDMENPTNVRVCLEIGDVGFDVFYDACATHNGMLWNVQGFRGAPFAPVTGTIQIDSDEVELRVEQEGTDVNFYARIPGNAWTPVSTTAFTPQTAAFKPSFGATGLSKGTVVGFDNLLFTTSDPPSAPAPAVAVAADVNAALLAGYAAYRQLEQPDFATAAVNLGQAQDAIDDAQAGLAGLPSSREVSSATKFVAKAEKALAKAQDQVADEAAEKAMKTLEKGGDSLVEAALLLNPQPFTD
jgi:hypothetical protein